MNRFHFHTKDGKTIITLTQNNESYFFKFDQIQGIVGNPKQTQIPLQDTCYAPVSKLIKRNKKS